ncbi:MAG: theronine dehydrogenase, partial [Alphaproteobacteria bacterium RIFOXYD12_FULL_60_8]
AGIANHAELNVVPLNLAVPVPDGVSDAEASFGTVAAIALHGVRNLDARLGETVALVGAGLVGLLACRFLALSGVRVVALDYDPSRLELAKTLGAELTWNLGAPDGLEAAVREATAGKGCDGVLICAATDSSDPLILSAELARDRARVVLVGKTGTEFPFAEFMKKEMSIVVSRSYGPGRYDKDYEERGHSYPVGFVRWTETENLAEALRLMAPGCAQRLDVAPLISHRFPFSEAEAAYALVTGHTEPHLGVVLEYPAETTATPKPAFAAVSRMPGKGCVLGVIGAGNFARTVLLPELKRLDGVSLRTLITQRGMTAEHGMNAFGFAHAGTDLDEVLNDPEINAVLIATRHGAHAELTARALASGKHVLVEKPLALDRDQLNSVIAARHGSKAFFTVGFNRRFAPMAMKMRAHLASRHGPKVLTLRVNAGAMPADSWINAADEGGGRILGEVCHFIDLARYLVGADIVSVQAQAAQASQGVCDDLTASISFADGSLASLVYTAQGDTAYSKERFEAFAGGSVITVDNFLEMTTAVGGTVRKEKASLGQDKGHRAELAAFVRAVQSGGPAPVDEAELIQTSLATIAVGESLRCGKRVEL